MSGKGAKERRRQKHLKGQRSVAAKDKLSDTATTPAMFQDVQSMPEQETGASNEHRTENPNHDSPLPPPADTAVNADKKMNDDGQIESNAAQKKANDTANVNDFPPPLKLTTQKAYRCGPNWVTAIATAIIAIANGVYAWYGYRQLNTFDKQLAQMKTDSESSSDATSRQLSIMEEQLREARSVSPRPWIGLEARGWRHLFPGQDRVARYASLLVPPEERHLLQGGPEPPQYGAYIVGCIVYHDRFGDRHFTGFAFEYHHPEAPVYVIFDPTPATTVEGIWMPFDGCTDDDIQQ